MGGLPEIIHPQRWKTVFEWGFGYTVCPYCGDKTEWYNPASQRFQTDLENNKRERCPKCGKRVFANEHWIMNQPPEQEILDKAVKWE